MHSYYRCPICNYISNDPMLDRPDIPCPKCAKPANSRDAKECRIMFLNLNAIGMLRSIEYFYNQMNQVIEGETKKLLSKIRAMSGRNLNEENLKVLADKLGEIENETPPSIDMPYDKMLQMIKSTIGIEETDVAEKIFSTLYGSYPPGTHEKNVVLILTCTFLEVCFDDFLTNILRNTGTSGNVAYMIVDELRSVDRKKSFCNKLTEGKFKEYLSIPGERKIFDDWSKISRLRNGIIHDGHVWSVTNEHAKESYDLTINSVDMFARLNNNFCIKEIS